jgi:hypothetical protein
VPSSSFGSKTEEVKGIWKKLHNEELHNLCSSPNHNDQIKNGLDMEEMRKAYTILFGNPEEDIILET